MENRTEFETEFEGDLVVMLEKIKLKMCNPSKVNCLHLTLFKQLERPLDAKQEDEELLIEHAKRLTSN